MSASFVHLEVLGARADALRWLAVLQDQGSCHVADALRGLEAEPHVGRPLPTETELQAERMAGAARRALQAVARVLPRAPRRVIGANDERLDWTIGFLGDGSEDAMVVLRDESLRIAASVRKALEQQEQAEHALRDHDALRAAFDALEQGGHLAARGLVFALPRSVSRARALKRQLRRQGHDAIDAHADLMSAVVVPVGHAARSAVDSAAVDSAAGESADAGDSRDAGAAQEQGAASAALTGDQAAVLAVAAAQGAHRVHFPEAWLGRPLVELRAALHSALDGLRQADGTARRRLHEIIADVGPRGRVLLDSLEDAAARTEMLGHLASTEHVAAARIYLRPEDEPALRAAMLEGFADQVVLRPLDEADDTPTLPKRLAAYPFAALAGMLPSRLGQQSLTSMLALLAPIAVAARWADMAGGLLLIGIGALLGTGARAGSPRRDTAVLAQFAGLAALITGVLWGRMFGAAGQTWFGTHWGLLGAEPPSLALIEVLRDVGMILGCAAAVPALYALVVFLRARAAGQAGRGRQVVGLALSGMAVFALAFAANGAPVWVWGFAVIAALGTAWMHGPRAVVLQLGLDVVGAVRLAAVGTAGVAAAEATFAGWIAPHAAAIVLAPLTLGIACLTMVADPAYVAMGVPYDVALGGHRLVHAFKPFARTDGARPTAAGGAQ